MNPKQTPEESRKEEVSRMNREIRDMGENNRTNRQWYYKWDDEDGWLNHNGRPISEHGE